MARYVVIGYPSNGGYLFGTPVDIIFRRPTGHFDWIDTLDGCVKDSLQLVSADETGPLVVIDKRGGCINLLQTFLHIQDQSFGNLRARTAGLATGLRVAVS